MYALARRLLRPRDSRRLRDRGTAAWLAPLPSALRAGSLPRGQSAVEPYRVTPKLALRVAILGGDPARDLRGALPAALGAAGARRPEVRRPGAGELVPDPARARAARPDRGPQRRPARHEHARDRDPALAVRPAEGLRRPVRRARASRPSLPRAAVRDLARHQGAPRERRPRDPRHGPRVGERPDGQLPPRALSRVPRRRRPAGRTSGTTRTRISALRCSATSARSRRRSCEHLGKGYDPNDEIGQTGVESAFDKYLRGVAGASKLRVDNLSRPLSRVQLTAVPKPGNTVRLTLNLKLQRAAEKRARLRHPPCAGERRVGGSRRRDRRARSARRLDPRDGVVADVQAVGVLGARDDESARESGSHAEDGARRRTIPSLNRAMQATYPPGSVFKPVTALAAMQEHLVSPYAYLPCTGTYQSPNDKSHQVFHNWDPNVNQQMDMPTALAYSCDTYFYQLGDRFFALPKDRGQPLQQWATMFGFGKLTGSDVGPGGSGARADDRLAHPPLQDRDRSLCGSRATRSTSRSGRATCS